MPEQYQPINVNTGSAQSAIQGTPNVTPNLEGLMQGIQSGFISADDIRKRVANGPLEAATRTQDLADVTQVRPLQREAATAQLQNVQAKEQFEAESLPILNDTKREQIKQDYQNVLQHGVPAAVDALFNQVVPQFIDFDPAKLISPGGTVNTAYKLDLIGKAIQKADQLKLRAGAKPVTITNVSDKGVKTTSEQNFTVMGQPVGAPIPTGVQYPNAAEVEQKAAAAQASLSNDFLAERNRSDILKQFVPQLKAFDFTDVLRARKTVPTNADDLAVIYEFVKALDPGSAVREGEKAFAESTAPLVQKFKNKFHGIWSDKNATLDDNTRANMYATMDTLKEGAERTVLPELKRFANIAFDRHVPLDQALTQPEIDLLVRGPKASAPVAGASPTPTTVAPAVPAAVIATPDRAAATAAANALPSNVEFFEWQGDTYRNKNFVKP